MNNLELWRVDGITGTDIDGLGNVLTLRLKICALKNWSYLVVSIVFFESLFSQIEFVLDMGVRSI